MGADPGVGTRDALDRDGVQRPAVTGAPSCGRPIQPTLGRTVQMLEDP